MTATAMASSAPLSNPHGKYSNKHPAALRTWMGRLERPACGS